MRTSLWPNGLISRVSFVLFGAIVLELLGSTFVFEQAELLSSVDTQARHVAEQLDAATRVLNVTEAPRRAAVTETLSKPDLALSWHADPGAAPPSDDATTHAMREKMLAAEPSLARGRLSIRADASDPKHVYRGRVDLVDGSALNFRATDIGSTLPGLYNQLGSIIVLSGCVLLAALLVVRTLAAPLRMLVQATDAIGHGPPVHLAEQGPREIRRVARAFNAMQARISNLLKDRTEALAAVSHDLRTPIGRMRLRTGFIASSEDQRAFESDLAEMEAMLNDLLAYLGGETDPEKQKPTDIAAVLQTLADAATDAGHSATYEGPDHLTLSVRPLALKRAFSNVINNALAYGERVRISLDQSAEAVVAIFDDDGPGIPQDELSKVFQPFYRSDRSRNRAKGGMGLGLAITQQAIWRQGGTIDLQNRGDGLRVTIRLPR